MSLVLLEHFLVHWCQVFSVHMTRDQEIGVSRCGLVHGVVPKNVGIVDKLRRHMIPEAHKLVLKTVLVAEEGTERCNGLLCQVIV